MKALRSELADKMIKQGIKIPHEEGATFEFEGKTYKVVKYFSSNEHKEKSKNFQKFFNIFKKTLSFFHQKIFKNFIKSSKDAIDIIPFEEKKDTYSIELEVRDMIKSGWLEGVFRYIEEGYDLNEQDCLLFLEQLSEAGYDTQKDYIHDIFLKKNLPIKYQAIFFFILHNHNSITDFKNIMDINQINDEFVFYVKSFWMSKLEIFNKFLKNDKFFYPDYHWRNTFLNYHETILHNITKKELQFIFESLKKIKAKKLSNTDISKMIEIIQKNSYKIISKDIENDIQKFKNKPTESHFSLKEIKNTVFAHQNQLSQKTKDILKDLQNLCENLNLEKLEKEELFQLQNISEKRIPEILQKYLSIDSEYRITLRNSKGQNAEELMNESLDELRDYLKIIHKKMNENKFNELAVAHQYVKSMHKSL